MIQQYIPGIEVSFDIGGIRLTARAAEGETAQRPKLLVIPGSYGEAARLAPALAKGFGDAFDWLCPDMHASRQDADFGDSQIAIASRLLGALADERFGGRPYGILGISIGGIVAAHLTVARPDVVMALAIDDPVIRTAQQWQVRDVVGKLHKAMPASDWRERLANYSRETLGFDPAFGSIDPRTHETVFTGVGVPLLVVAGDIPLLPERKTTDLTGCIDAESEAALRAAYRGPFFSLVRIAGLGHSCLFQAPEVCGPIYTDFFAKFLPGAANTGPGEALLAARGLEHAKAGRIAEAFGDFRRLSTLRPNDPGIAWFAAAMAIQAGDTLAALSPLLTACVDSVDRQDRLRTLEAILRGAPAGKYEAYRHAVREIVRANPNDEALLRAYIAAFPSTCDPLGDATFLAEVERSDHAPGTLAQIAYARAVALRAIGEADAAREIARGYVDAWASQAADLMLLLTGIYAHDASDSAIAADKSFYYRNLEARGAERALAAPKITTHARPRLGFLSACLDQESYMPLAHPLFAALDHDAVETFLLPLGGTGVLKATEAVLPPGTIHYVPALSFASESDPTAWRMAADYIRALDLDLLVDMDDVLGPFSARLMMLRPARRQATWFNMSGPNPDPSIDYVLGYESLYPPDELAYEGKIVHLPDGAFIYDPDCVDKPHPPIVPGPLSRGEGFTFGSLTQLYKVGAPTLDLWAKVLRAVPSARFHLANRDVALPGMAAHLLVEFESRGVAASRISFGSAHGWPGYLEAYRDIDVALATVPVSGGTTMFQAAWQGVEVLSRVHNSPLGRIGRWLAKAIDRPWTAHDDDESLVAEAIRIAADPTRALEWRANARARLIAKRDADAARMARAFEELAKRSQ
ncbi:MAG: alpha/beta fold hydrolase [Proteobacteria bacterium]|nr:alpha/beta fold hydrolase [Pseudomonadota bacterium]